jgi:CubicO group peptidase (beta-lactamase class C family)
MKNTISTCCLRRTTALGAAIGLALAALAVAAAAPGADAVVGGELGARLDALAEQARADGFHGVLLVAQDGNEVLAKGYGLADEGTRTAFSPSTVVPIGSCVKDFTKVAIYQLVEAGKLRLDDTLGKFFPAAPEDKRGITVQNLLDHRAGLPLGVGLDEVPLSKQEFLDRVFAVKLESAPGSTERYSNAGFSVLAAIVEQLSGESFDAYVERAILRPLGLADTGLLTPRFAPARLAHAYAGKEDRGTMLDRPHMADGHGWALRGNGGYLSTVRDMLRFFRGVHGDRLLREPEHRDAVLPRGGPTVLAGSDLVSFFLFANYPGARVEVVLASNHDDYQGPRLLDAIEPALGLGGPREGGGRRRSGAGAGGEIANAPEVALPETPRGRVVGEYLLAFNADDEAAMSRFLDRHAATGPDTPPLAQRLENFHRLRRTLGRVTVVGVEETGEGLALTVRGEREGRAKLTFMVEDKEPYRFRGLQIEIG